jgi:hypothetical protein
VFTLLVLDKQEHQENGACLLNSTRAETQQLLRVVGSVALLNVSCTKGSNYQVAPTAVADASPASCCVAVRLAWSSVVVLIQASVAPWQLGCTCLVHVPPQPGGFVWSNLWSNHGQCWSGDRGRVLTRVTGYVC